MNLRKIHNISLKWKLLIPFLFLSFVGTTSLILLSLNNQRRLIETQEKKKLTDYYRAFLDQIEDRERSALSLAYQVSSSPAVQESFAQRDRQALVELLLPSYQILKEKFGVKQFHFHVKPATSFLRLHRIYQFGETMESFRQTINRVVETGDGIAGLEWGLTGFGVRGVAPVYYRDALIGTFEIGYSVERTFLEALKRRYNMDLSLIVARETGRSFHRLVATSATMPLLLDKFYSQVFRTQKPEILISQPRVPGLAILLGPLLDFSGRSIGVVEIAVDRAATLSSLARNRNIMIGIMMVALAASSTLIVWVVILFLRPVHGIVDVAREISAGKRVKRIDVEVHDEIGILADSLNEMLESLNQARREVQQYCDTLEEQVQARTWELVEEKEKFETLVENAPLIVYRIEPDFTTVFVNRFVEETMGYTSTEVVTDRAFWSKTAHPEDREKVLRHLETCLSKGQESLVEYRASHKNGAEVYLLNHAMPLRDRRGIVQAVDGIIVDVTERIRLQENIIQTEELKTLSSISARLAHEIRNPLTSAGGFARRLLKEMDPGDNQRAKVEIIVQEVTRLEQILKMILSYIRPLPLHFSEVDLNDIMLEAVTAARDMMGSQRIELELDLDDTLPHIHADRSHLRQAMETILRKACEHMPQKSILSVTTTHNGGAVIQLCYPALHVADDDMDHFFSPFVAEELEKADLEVPLTKVVIHRHGGIISINRDEDEQIVITINFSLRATAAGASIDSA